MRGLNIGGVKSSWTPKQYVKELPFGLLICRLGTIILHTLGVQVVLMLRSLKDHSFAYTFGLWTLHVFAYIYMYIYVEIPV